MDLINPDDPLDRQNAKLLKITQALMRRVEQHSADSGVAYAQFERAAMLDEEVRNRTRDLEHALDLLNESNSRLAQANAETEAARADLANAIETLQEGFALFNAEDVLVMCNSRFGKHMQDVHHLFRPGLAFADYVRLVSRSPHLSLPEDQTPRQWAEQRMSRHKDDHVVFNARVAGSRWLQVSEHRTGDGGTVVVQTDVTDMVRLERQERERLLDDQARLIRATLEHLSQGVCIFDQRNRLVGWNHRAGELLSVPLSRFRIGRSLFSLLESFDAHVGYVDPATPTTIEAWVNRRTRRTALDFEIRIGTDRTLVAFAQRMPDAGFVISFTDVSAERAAMRAISEVNETLERRVMERTLELEDALAEAERANASKSRFVAAASHDLLQPLSAAKLYVASLESALDDPELQQRLGKAANALVSVEHILEALLDISKLDSGKAAVHLSEVPLGRMLEQLCDEFSGLAGEKGLKLRVVPTGAAVLSDATFLRRILQNLISNAIRYTEAGTVLVGARRCRDKLRVEVWDTGPGIPASQQEAVFAEFHRLEATASPANGMGLGLAIVERACRLLNHPLNLESCPGRGTRFSVELPRVRGQAAETGRVAAPSVGGPLPHCIVLVLENDDELRNALVLILESWGLDVFACAGLPEAMSLLEEVDIAPDAILADYQLDGGILGTEAIDRIRRAHGPIPSCVITANRGGAPRRASVRVGAQLIYKPVDPSELRAFLAGCAIAQPAARG